MRVCRQCTADRQLVCTGLLLHDAPLPRGISLGSVRIGHELRPLDAGFYLDEAPLGIESKDAVHATHVDQCRIRAKLLATHGVSPARDTDALSARRGFADGGLDVRQRRRLDQSRDPSRIQA